MFFRLPIIQPLSLKSNIFKMLNVYFWSLHQVFPVCRVITHFFHLVSRSHLLSLTAVADHIHLTVWLCSGSRPWRGPCSPLVWPTGWSCLDSNWRSGWETNAGLCTMSNPGVGDGALRVANWCAQVWNPPWGILHWKNKYFKQFSG